MIAVAVSIIALVIILWFIVAAGASLFLVINWLFTANTTASNTCFVVTSGLILWGILS